MKLYRKKLDGLEALRMEKVRLRYERRHLQPKDLNPFSELGRTRLSGTAKSGLLATVIGLFSSGSQWQTALTIGRPILNVIRRRRAKAREIRYATAGRPHKKSFAKRFIAEIAVNYLIGKALQLSIRGFRSYLHRKKAAKVPSFRR